MRTKFLLCVATIAAASIASASAQVYSVNAVGYVNKTVPAKGFALISNALNAPTNTISALLTGQVPTGAQVFAWNTTTKSYDIASFDQDFGWDMSPQLAAKQFAPGTGFFIKNPSASAITITFVGEVPQGTLTTTLVPGFQIVSSQVPQQGALTALGYTPANGDKVYKWDATKQAYAIASFDKDFGWDPSEPSVDVGEAFFLSTAAAGTWTRTFSVGQ